METKQLLALLATSCAIATEVGCVSADRQMSRSSFDATTLNRDGGQSSAEFAQQVNLNQLASQKPDLNTNGAVTLDEWQRFEPSAGPKENVNAIDIDGAGQINATKFLTQTPKHSKRYDFFGDPEKTDKDYSSWDEEEFQPQGLQLFSIHF